MSLISRSFGGSPPGKSTSGLSMLTKLLLLRGGQPAQSYRTAVLQNGQDVDGEDQRGVGRDALLSLGSVAELRRDDDQHPAADLLAGQPLRPALDHLLQRE